MWGESEFVYLVENEEVGRGEGCVFGQEGILRGKEDGNLEWIVVF